MSAAGCAPLDPGDHVDGLIFTIGIWAFGVRGQQEDQCELFLW